ncbi:MAG: 5-oxoprolinase subunit PxpB [Thermodesulfobacteriota bacterium]
MGAGLFKAAQFRIAGDSGLLVEYGDSIHPDVNHKVRSMSIILETERIHGIKEIIPTYRSILVVYNPLIITPLSLKCRLSDLENRLSEIEIPPPKRIEIPVYYGGSFGPDIGFVATTHSLSEEEVIRIHSQPDYLIYMVGFTPGFPFLGGLPDILHTPRLETPRIQVPAGSVGIANAQTGIYPVTSPGGWRLIGRTPLRLFDKNRKDPILYKAGDRIRFKPISESEYQRLAVEQKNL